MTSYCVLQRNLEIQLQITFYITFIISFNSDIILPISWRSSVFLVKVLLYQRRITIWEQFHFYFSDPYCGWCSLENKCSLRGDCRDAAQDPLYWISYKSGRCTTITSVQPQELQRTTARTLSLVIDNLPTLAGQFVCVFQALGKTLVTNATR